MEQQDDLHVARTVDNQNHANNTDISRGQNHMDDASFEKPNPPTTVDLRNLDYVSEFDRHLACPICRCPFIDAVRLACDHTYCRSCYIQAIRSQPSGSKTCPTCRRSVREEPLNIPRFTRHMIDDLIVRCPNAHLGCRREVQRSEIQDHVDYYCPFTLVACPSSECQKMIARACGRERCLHEEISCPHCQIVMPEIDLEYHLLQQCTKLESLCEDCGASYLHSNRTSHANACSESSISCNARAFGCKFEGKRAAVELHAVSCPLATIAPCLENMNKRFADQEIALRSLQIRNDLLETSFAALWELLDATAASSNNLSSPTSSSVDPAASTIRTPGASPNASSSSSFDPVTHHMLSLHESLRGELDNLTSAVAESYGRLDMKVMNETLRVREEMSHTNAVVSNLRIQLQWLTNDRLQAQTRGPIGNTSLVRVTDSTTNGEDATVIPNPPIRRLSDPSRQNTKL